MSKPWGVQPDGTTLTPAPGMLVAYQQPGDTAIFWGIVAESSDFCARYERDEADGYYPEDVIQGPHFTHLAPPPQPGKLWEALIMLGEVGECSDELTIALERGDIHASPYTGSNQKNYEPCEGIVDEWDYNNGTMRDMQKFGALLAYCAQEGWE